MTQIPFATPELQERFSSQVICTLVSSPSYYYLYTDKVISANIMVSPTLVVIVHELCVPVDESWLIGLTLTKFISGNLRVELDSVKECIPHLEHSYIVGSRSFTPLSD